MTDNKAPERIWAVTEEGDVSAQILGDVYAQQTPEGMVGKPVEYVRADLAPMVKPLEWDDYDEKSYCKSTTLLSWGRYEIGRYRGDWCMGEFTYPAREAAKAAAQADYERRILSALDLAPVTAQGWQPIETAPKDGTWVLVRYSPFWPVVACYHDGMWREPRHILDGEVDYDTWPIEEWMPLFSSHAIAEGEQP